MSNWPFYFALIILLMLINIKIKEPNTGELINNIQKSINYGESAFNKENDTISGQVGQTLTERDEFTKQDYDTRGQIDICTADLTKEKENNVRITNGLNTCNNKLTTQTGLVQDCVGQVNSLNGQTTQYNINIQSTQADTKQCEYLLLHGDEPPPRDPKDIALEEAARNAANNLPKHYYSNKYDQCNADLQAAWKSWNDRHPPPPPRGCVIL